MTCSFVFFLYLTQTFSKSLNMGKNLYQKIFESHTVAKLPSGQCQLFIGLHLCHEVTSPQAFAMLREEGQKVLFPERTFATVDHIIPTTFPERNRPLQDGISEEMFAHIEKNTKDFGVRFLALKRKNKVLSISLVQKKALHNQV